MSKNRNSSNNRGRDSQDNYGGRRRPNGVASLLDARGAQALLELQGMQGRRGTWGDNTRIVPNFDHLLGDLRQLREEGVDHINVANAAKTDIGRVFSLVDLLSYRDSILETNIQSLRVYSFFLKTGMQEPKLLVPYALPPGTSVPDAKVPNMFALQAHGIWEKIQAIKPMQEMLQSLTVPLDWYLVKDGKKQRTVTGAAYAAALLEIQRALRAGESPDFTDFFDLGVQADLRRLERPERLVAIQKLLCEALHPVRDEVAKIREEQRLAKERRIQAEKEERKQQRRRPQADKATGEPEVRGRAEQRKRPAKGPRVKSLNHMVPNTTNAGPTPAPVIPAAPVEQVATSMTAYVDANRAQQELDRLTAEAAAQTAAPVAAPAPSFAHAQAETKLVTNLSTVGVPAVQEPAAPVQAETAEVPADSAFAGVVADSNTSLGMALASAMQAKGMQLSTGTSQSQLELGNATREVELPAGALGGMLVATPDVLQQVAQVAEAAGDTTDGTEVEINLG